MPFQCSTYKVDTILISDQDLYSLLVVGQYTECLIQSADVLCDKRVSGKVKNETVVTMQKNTGPYLLNIFLILRQIYQDSKSSKDLCFQQSLSNGQFSGANIMHIKISTFRTLITTLNVIDMHLLNHSKFPTLVSKKIKGLHRQTASPKVPTQFWTGVIM